MVAEIRTSLWWAWYVHIMKDRPFPKEKQPHSQSRAGTRILVF